MEKWVIPSFLEGKFENSLWVNFEAKEFLSQSGLARGASIRSGGNVLGSWKLLAPKEIAESVSHDWGEKESIGTRIAQKIGDVSKATTEILGAKKTGQSTFESAKGSLKNDQAISARDLMGQVAGGLASTQIEKYKIDTALSYQDSKRREYSLTFNFAITHINGNTKTEVFDPIRKLEELSCAQLGAGLINIEYPAIFRIWSSPGDIIKINNAVITSVQPTYSAPYINGYPTHCELQITFTDLEPLYRSSFGYGNPVRTSRSS